MKDPVNTGRSGKLEVLAPAGSFEALIAAIRCGADAIYLGTGKFNARQNAQNFDAAALRQATALCHSHGVKLYLTLNTLVRQNEMHEALLVAQQACEIGVDAIILQDIGLARRIRASAPKIQLHASTQLSCHTPAGVRELADMGFSRVILAREMSRDEIAECAGNGAELEVFVHGALCMSVSGQCMMSAMLGGRSGNRGLCAGPCRLPFMPTLGQAVPKSDQKVLSLKDLSLIGYVSELASIGVCSLKIEGRMKRPEYVAAATSCYSAASTGTKNIDPNLLNDLQAVFSRSGFTDGYYTGRQGKNMFGSRTYEDVTAAAPVLKRLAQLYSKETGRIPVKLKFVVRSGQPAVLFAKDDSGNFAKAFGDVPQPAINRPLDEVSAAAQLQKTGGTPFFVKITCDIEHGLAMSLSSINSLRRQVLDDLLKQRSLPHPVPFNKTVSPPPPLSARSVLKKEKMPVLVARFANANQIPKNTNADVIVLPLDTPVDILSELSIKHSVFVEVPRGMFGSEKSTLDKLIGITKAGVSAALCNNIGAIALARTANIAAVAYFGMNITNVDALNALVQHGVSAAVLSQELTFKQMSFARRALTTCGIVAYGRQPLMLTRNCPYSAFAGCDRCKGKASLTDRRGVSFPITCSGGCSELLNSAPLWLADQLSKLPPLDFIVLHFTIESRQQTADIIDAYRSGSPPPENFTRGLYKRGVE